MGVCVTLLLYLLLVDLFCVVFIVFPEFFRMKTSDRLWSLLIFPFLSKRDVLCCRAVCCSFKQQLPLEKIMAPFPLHNLLPEEREMGIEKGVMMAIERKERMLQNLKEGN